MLQGGGGGVSGIALLCCGGYWMLWLVCCSISDIVMKLLRILTFKFSNNHVYVKKFSWEHDMVGNGKTNGPS